MFSLIRMDKKWPYQELKIAQENCYKAIWSTAVQTLNNHWSLSSQSAKTDSFLLEILFLFYSGDQKRKALDVNF